MDMPMTSNGLQIPNTGASATTSATVLSATLPVGALAFASLAPPPPVDVSFSSLSSSSSSSYLSPAASSYLSSAASSYLISPSLHLTASSFSSPGMSPGAPSFALPRLKNTFISPENTFVLPPPENTFALPENTFVSPLSGKVGAPSAHFGLGMQPCMVTTPVFQIAPPAFAPQVETGASSTSSFPLLPLSLSLSSTSTSSSLTTGDASAGIRRADRPSAKDLDAAARGHKRKRLAAQNGCESWTDVDVKKHLNGDRQDSSEDGDSQDSVTGESSSSGGNSSGIGGGGGGSGDANADEENREGQRRRRAKKEPRRDMSRRRIFESSVASSLGQRYGDMEEEEEKDDEEEDARVAYKRKKRRNKMSCVAKQDDDSDDDAEEDVKDAKDNSAGGGGGDDEDDDGSDEARPSLRHQGDVATGCGSGGGSIERASETNLAVADRSATTPLQINPLSDQHPFDRRRPEHDRKVHALDSVSPVPSADIASRAIQRTASLPPPPQRVRKVSEKLWKIKLVKSSLSEDFPDILCAICQEVMWDPMQITGCQHMFCKSCLTRTLRTRNKCPLCNASDIDLACCQPYKMANSGGYRMIFGKLKVYCPLHRGSGCTWEGDYTDSAIHIHNVCTWHPMKCDYCHQHYLRGDLQAHRTVCDLRPVICLDCDCVVIHTDMHKHQSEVCLNTLVTCSTSILPDNLGMEANDVYAKEGGDGGGGSDGGFSGGWLDDGTDGGFEANSQTDVLRGRRVRLLDNDKKTAPVCGCGLTMQRRRLLSHQRNECVKRLVTCAFNEHGCTTAVPWDAIVTHDTTYMARHLALVSRKLALVSRVAAIETTRDWTARYGHIAYRFGGDDGKTELGSALSYDILGATRHKHLATWMSLPNLPTPRGFVACARWRNRVYVTGGYVRSRNVTVRSNECYVIDEAKWTTLAPMMTARNGHIVLATDTAVYVLGGTSGEVKATNHCETYDPRTNVWTEMPPMMVRRRHHTGVCYNNKLYVFGGSLGKITTEDLLPPSAECYDPVTRRWTTLRPPGMARANGRAIVVDGHVYVMGGSILSAGRGDLDADHAMPDDCKKTLFTTSVECYDIERDIWLPVAWKLPHQAVSFSVKYADGRILVAGGWVGGAVNTTHIMDMTTCTWTQLAKLPEAVDKCAHC